jgi:hypothetical protein
VSFLCRCFSRGNLTALVKDPRQTVVLPSWLEIARELEIEVKVAFIFRSPLDVAESLNARDGIALEEGLDLWARYNGLGEAYTRDVPRIVVDYDEVRTSPDTIVARLLDFMGEAGVFSEAAAGSIAVEARRQSARGDGLGSVKPEVRDVYAALQGATAPDAMRPSGGFS